MFRISYTPLAQRDIFSITQYLLDTLDSPQAASTFLDKLDTTIETLAQFPYSCPLYRPPGPLPDEIRFTLVKNYVLYFAVLDDVVEIRRVIHGSRNRDSIEEKM